MGSDDALDAMVQFSGRPTGVARSRRIDFQILPVVVVVRWRSAAGGGQVQLETILGVE